ncbi:MAG: tetratricopeptide repeat protein [Proteobacteria bacterium]|nr:tetratricopeptide repeat protein [Pseudomonadota bacterium]
MPERNVPASGETHPPSSEQGEVNSNAGSGEPGLDVGAESDGGGVGYEPSPEEQEKLRELDARLQRFQTQRRWSDFIRTLIAKAELIRDPEQKIELLREAGRMYLDKSSNQSEAIKCFQRVLEHSSHDVEAITRLKGLYEKRRDWERLIGTMKLEAELLEPDERPERWLEIARLATERVRKPAVCIELWQALLDDDPSNPEALTALSALHERARNWAPLAEALERQVEFIADERELIAALQKLGMTYADKLKDDEGAIRAFRRLLDVQPDDRRAQEQLKRRYVAKKAWDELEEFYARTEKWDELIRTLERAADSSAAEPGEKLDLLFRVARLWGTQRNKPDRAARAYEKVLALDPQNSDAAAALIPVYEASGDARKLASVYQVRLKQQLERPERLLMLRELGLLFETQLRAPDRAFEAFLEAYSLDPVQDAIRQDVERLADRVSGWSRVVQVLTEAIKEATDPEATVGLRLHLGSVLAREGRAEEAIACFEAVWEIDPDNAQAIEALDALYRDTANDAGLLHVLQRRADLEDDPQTRRGLCYQIARLLEERLQDGERAIQSYQALIEEYGNEEPEAYVALERLYESAQRWQEFAEVLERRIALAGDTDELATLKFRLAKASAGFLDDGARAVELYREVVTLAPEHEGARDALEGLLNDARLGGEVARVLEPIYEAVGDWPKLAGALEALMAHSESPDERLEYFTKAAEVYIGPLQDPARGFDMLCRAWRERPHNDDILARLQVLATEQDRVAELVQLLEELAGTVQDQALGRQLWMRAAHQREAQLEDSDGAISAYQRALAYDPDDPEVVEAIDAVYQRTGRWAELLALLRQRSELANEQDKIQLLARMAQVHEHELAEPDEAISRYIEILELSPNDLTALRALDGLFERQERWTDLADNVERQLRLAEDSQERASCMVRLARIRQTHLGDTAGAIEIYREVLEADPYNADSMAELERLLQDPEYRLTVTDILEPHYRAHSEFRKLIGIQEIRLEHSHSPDYGVALLHDVAELYEVALDDFEGAFTAYARALAEDPANEQTQEHLGRIARSAGTWDQLASVYEERVGHVDDPALAAKLHVKAAGIREEHLSDADGAIAHYCEVLELEPEHLEAATALERLYELAERYEDLAAIYFKKAAMLEAPEQRKEHCFRAAFIYEELLDRPQDAVETFRRVLEVDPEDVAAVDKLIELHLRLEQWQELLAVYERKADMVHDPEDKKALYAEVGAVYERELGDVPQAIDTYQRILEVDPDDVAALARLDALYHTTESWRDLLSVLEREAALTSDPHESASFRFRVGELWDTKLQDSERAIECYRAIVDDLGWHAPSVKALERMVAGGREALSAAEVLEPLYRGEGDWAKLVGVLEVQAAHEQDRVRKVELLHQVAELNEVHLDRPQDALDAYARALSADRENPDTLHSLERLAEQLQAWGEVARLLDAQLQILSEIDPDSVVELMFRVAEIYEQRVVDQDTAIERYRAVYEADPGHVEAIQSLDRLYGATRRWGELAKILLQEVELAGTPDEVLSLRYRLGKVHETFLGRVGEALKQYQEVLAAAPDHAETIQALEGLFDAGIEPLAVGEILEPLYRDQENYGRLVDIQEIQLRYQADVSERVAMMHRMAETAEDRAEDLRKAFFWVQRALLEDPLHEHSRHEAERLAGSLQAWDILANTYASVLESSEDPEVITGCGRALVRIYEHELHDVHRAEETGRFVISHDPGEAEVLQTLDRLYQEHGAHEALAEILTRRIAITEDPLDLVELNFRLGQVLDRDLGRGEDAIRVFVHIVEDLAPDHQPTIFALESIYTRRADWPSLYKAFELESQTVFGDSERAQVFGRMARLAHDRLGDPVRAIALWEQVLELGGEQPEALNALGNIHASRENWTDLVEVLEREAAVVEGDDLRVSIYADLGRIWYEKLGRDRSALESWERVLDIEPGSTAALFAIAEIHRAAGSFNDLVDTLHRVSEVGATTLDEATLEEVHMQLGTLYLDKLQQPAEAVESYQLVLDVNPRNLAALDALELIHRREGQWDDCVAVLQKRAEALTEDQSRIEVLLAVAEMADEQLGDEDRSAKALHAVLEIDPLHERAFKRLDGAYREAARFEELVDLYLHRIEADEDLEARVRLLCGLAEIYEQDLGDRDRAFDALQLAWTQDFTRDEVAERLERVAGLTQRWNELLTTANGVLGTLGEEQTDTKIAVCLKCARWYNREGRPDYAIPYLEQVLAIEPRNLSAMKGMADLYQSTEQWDVYGKMLAKISEMTEEARDLAEVLVRMGELHGEHLGQPERAIGYYEQALQAFPSQPRALEALEHLYG